MPRKESRSTLVLGGCGPAGLLRGRGGLVFDKLTSFTILVGPSLVVLLHLLIEAPEVSESWLKLPIFEFVSLIGLSVCSPVSKLLHDARPGEAGVDLLWGDCGC